jgi:hypothetical protein
MRLLLFYLFSLSFIHAILLGRIVFAKFYTTNKFCRPSLRYLKNKQHTQHKSHYTPPGYPHNYPPGFTQHFYTRPLIIPI